MENNISKDTLTSPGKLNVIIQNFDFVTHSEYDNLEQQVESQFQEHLSYIVSLSMNVSKLEKELKEYKEHVEHEYVKVPVKMNWIRKLLFRIMFGEENKYDI